MATAAGLVIPFPQQRWQGQAQQVGSGLLRDTVLRATWRDGITIRCWSTEEVAAIVWPLHLRPLQTWLIGWQDTRRDSLGPQLRLHQTWLTPTAPRSLLVTAVADMAARLPSLPHATLVICTLHPLRGTYTGMLHLHWHRPLVVEQELHRLAAEARALLREPSSRVSDA